MASGREAALAGNESDNQPASSVDGLSRVRAFLTAIDFEFAAIDFEVAAALSLSGGGYSQPHSDVYLTRALTRVAEHMKSLQAIQAALNQPRDGNSTPDLHIVNRAS